MKLDKNNKAWMLLVEDERLALNLNLGLRKSTWKAGEIMKKSHYKLIEIKDRAKTFLKIFTYHFQEYGELIPKDMQITPDLREYLTLTIIKRLPINKAIREIDSPLYHHQVTREKVISDEIIKWKSSVSLSQKDLYNLVLDFDRWNNFRILPKNMQEPSAFKRRDKNRLKKHLKLGTSISPLAYKIIKKKYQYTSNRKINAGYLILISEEPRRTEIIKILANPENLADLSRSSLYIFDDENIATVYLQLILEYIRKEDKHCSEGLRFWPKYREIIKKAINYNLIQNIIPSRKNLEFIEPSRIRKNYF